MPSGAEAGAGARFGIVSRKPAGSGFAVILGGAPRPALIAAPAPIASRKMAPGKTNLLQRDPGVDDAGEGLVFAFFGMEGIWRDS